jgi:4a-hydroxytetrahydrobiopterin dehydratase
MADSRLSGPEIKAKLAGRPGWRRDGEALVREFHFTSFPDAIAFTTRLAFDAQAADHHPDLTVSYKRVTVRWSTHSAGGITTKDLIGVAQADEAASSFRQK